MTTGNNIDKYPSSENLVDQVDDLADQVKTLALNLAISLAREKNEIKDLALLEPEFTRLIYGSVNVIREITKILRALRGEGQKMLMTPADGYNFSRIEASLNEILNLSRSVLKTIRELKEQKDAVDKYK